MSDGAANRFAIGSEVEVSDGKENRGGRGGGASEMRIYRVAFCREHHIASKGNRR